MHITRIEVEGYKVIKDFAADFPSGPKHQIFLVGPNGSGKTTLLNLIAGIAGNEKATNLVAHQPIGRVRIEMADDETSKKYTFEAKDILSPTKINAFKAAIESEKLVSYGLTEYADQDFIVGRCNYATLEAFLNGCARRYEGIFEPKRFGNGYSIYPGDGSQRTISLYFLLCCGWGPLLLDTPESHLDITRKRALTWQVNSFGRQVISTTHSPEWLANVDDWSSFCFNVQEKR